MSEQPTTGQQERDAMPVTRHELELIFERGYDLASRQELAMAWSVTQHDTSTADLVEDAMEEEARATQIIAQASEQERQTLDMLVSLGARARGEQLRKALLLRGQTDCTEAMMALMKRHVLLVMPPSSHSELDVTQIIDQHAFLQYELALGAALYRELDGEQDVSGQLDVWQDEVVSERAESQQSLELNLLHLMAYLYLNPLRLNKSGAPNRRAAARAIEGLLRPASGHLPDPWLALDESGQDYFAFLLGLAAQLGLTHIKRHTVLAHTAEVRAFFRSPRHVRQHHLLDAIQKVRGWNEWVSAHAESKGLSEDIVELQLSQFVENGAELIGARGYLISVIRRARISGWVPLQAVLTLCTQLDRDYLPRIVERFSEHEATEDGVQRYVCAFIEHALFWTGLVKLGRGPLGERLVALTEHGEEVLGRTESGEPDSEQVEEPLTAKGSLIVQPNYEIMVFLDAVTTPTLAFLYEVAERVALANRVATFKLDAASVQRGYALGLDGDAVINELNACSLAPLADSVEFQVRDWERVWGRMVLWARGVLLRHEDPDKLDDVISELRYALRDAPPVMERIAAGSIFIDGEVSEAFDKVLQRHQNVTIDYLGTQPPSLSLEGPLRFGYDPLVVDFVTINALQHIAHEVKELCSPKKRVVELNRVALRSHWPEDTLRHSIAFLHERVPGGCPPDQVLRLRHLFGLEDGLEVRHNLVMLELAEDLADLIMHSDLVSDMFIKRYGPGAVAVDAEQAEELLAWLSDIGVKINE